jgi:hypothetical protein
MIRYVRTERTGCVSPRGRDDCAGMLWAWGSGCLIVVVGGVVRVVAMRVGLLLLG